MIEVMVGLARYPGDRKVAIGRSLLSDFLKSADVSKSD